MDPHPSTDPPHPSTAAPHRPTPRSLLVVGAVVALIEVGLTAAGLGGEPMVLVDGWAPTRPTDLWTVTLAVIGCAAVFALGRAPVIAAAVAAGSYVLIAALDHEFGMTLPAMVAIGWLAATAQRRSVAALTAVCCTAAALWWVTNRAATITAEGVDLLAIVAFGTVSAVFFGLPALVGEIVRLRRQVRAGGTPVSA